MPTRRTFVATGISAWLFLPPNRSAAASCPCGETYSGECETCPPDPIPNPTPNPITNPTPIENPPVVSNPGNEPIATDPIAAATGGDANGGGLFYSATGGQVDLGLPSFSITFGAGPDASVISYQAGGLSPTHQSSTSASNSYPGASSGTGGASDSSPASGSSLAGLPPLDSYVTQAFSSIALQPLQIGSEIGQDTGRSQPYAGIGGEMAYSSSGEYELTVANWSHVNGYAGAISSFGQAATDGASFGTNLRYYQNVFNGNQFVSTIKVEPIIGSVGKVFAAGSVALDIIQLFGSNDKSQTASLWASFASDATGLAIALFVADWEMSVPLSLGLFGLNELYPGGAYGGYKDFVSLDIPGLAYGP